MTFSYIFISTCIALATSSGVMASNLRAQQNKNSVPFDGLSGASLIPVDAGDNDQQQEPGRDLQLLNANLFGAVFQAFGPQIVEELATTLNRFDPITLGDETSFDFGGLDLSVRTNGAIDCQSSASVTYGLGSIFGLSSIEVNRVEMVPGSETFDSTSVLGLGGAAWGGTWIMNATFANVTATTSAGLEASACGVPLSQSVEGTTSLIEPSAEIRVTLGGNTENLMKFTTTSQIESVQVEEVKFKLGSINADMGVFGNIIQLDLGHTLDGFLLNELSDIVAPLAVNFTNNALKSQLPFSF